MELILYKNFSKRINSLKIPDLDTDHDRFNIRLKTNTSVESPTFILNENIEDATKYTYALFKDHFYYINDISFINNGQYEISCTQDVLATYRDLILDSEFMIERSNYFPQSYPAKVDTQLGTSSTPWRNITTYASPFPATASSCSVILTCISTDTSPYTGGTGVYWLRLYNGDTSVSDIGSLLSYMASSTSLQESLLKILNNVYSAIIDVKILPHYSPEYLTTLYSGAIQLFGSSAAVRLGATPTSINAVKAADYNDGQPIVTTTNMDISGLLHFSPTADYRNKEPYSKMYLYLPYYGVVNIPLTDYIGFSNYVIIKTSVDPSNGTILYQRINSEGKLFEEYRASMGINIQLSQITTDTLAQIKGLVGVTAGVAGLAASAITAKPTDIISSATGIIGSVADLYVANNTRNLSTAGHSAGSLALAESQIDTFQIMIEGFESNTTDADQAESYGKPVMERAKLSDIIGGYVKCNNASIEGDMLNNDRIQINNYLNSGFYIE